MKKRNIILLVSFFSLILIPIPKYVELNHLILVDSIEIECSNNQYHVSFKEIIPKKEDNGIEYEYKTYTKSGDNLDNVIHQIEEDKPFYYKRAKIDINNCKNKKIIKNYFK